MLASFIDLPKCLDNMPAGESETPAARSYEGHRSAPVRFQWLRKLRQLRLGVYSRDDCECRTETCRVFFECVTDRKGHRFSLANRQLPVRDELIKAVEALAVLPRPIPCARLGAFEQ